MFNVKLAGMGIYIYIYGNGDIAPVWETAVHLAVAGGVFDGVFLCCPFSH